uniref:Uncharacterized protein n=1 Tax=Rhizophagus irregularis (strain DAOM 181602 / DAOM 197198 / MUCL 43194) TaxID=747089 RepID=U9SIG2_RHIID
MTVHASPIREVKYSELMKRCNDGGAGCGSGDGLLHLLIVPTRISVNGCWL